jgi:hypothetical protein
MKRNLLLVSILALSISFASVAFAVSLPGGEANFETSLQSRISTSDTSMTLVSNSLKGGGILTGYHCFTLDEGRTDAEFICGTIASTAVTGLERGVSYLNGTTTVPSIQYAHRVGADVKITDYPLIERILNLLTGKESFAGLMTYLAGTDCNGSSPSNTICGKSYIDSVGSAGAANASETVKGLSELATPAEQAAGTSLGGTGARLVVAASSATSTCQFVQASVLIASTTTGKLDKACLDLSPPFAFLNAVTSPTSTTGTLNVGTINATSSIKIGGLSVLTSVPKYSLISSSGTGSPGGAGYATSTSILGIPAGTLTASSTITLMGPITCFGGSQTCTYYLRDTGGTTLASCQVSASANNFAGTLNMFVANQSSLASQASVSSCVISQLSGTATTNSGSAGGGATTSTYNTAGALNLVVVVQATSANTVSVSSYSIVVNP